MVSDSCIDDNPLRVFTSQELLQMDKGLFEVMHGLLESDELDDWIKVKQAADGFTPATTPRFLAINHSDLPFDQTDEFGSALLIATRILVNFGRHYPRGEERDCVWDLEEDFDWVRSSMKGDNDKVISLATIGCSEDLHPATCWLFIALSRLILEHTCTVDAVTRWVAWSLSIVHHLAHGDEGEDWDVLDPFEVIESEVEENRRGRFVFRDTKNYLEVEAIDNYMDYKEELEGEPDDTVSKSEFLTSLLFLYVLEPNKLVI